MIIRTALCWQLGAGLAGMAAAVWFFDVGVALGLGFGVLVAMFSALMLGRRIDAAASAQPEIGQRMLYAGAVARFVTVLLALLLAYWLGLHLLAVAAGMLLAQVAIFAYAARHARQSFNEH